MSEPVGLAERVEMVRLLRRMADALDYPPRSELTEHALRAEVERLRGLIARAETDSAGWCPWCNRYERSGHAPDCSAFSARGEVRR